MRLLAVLALVAIASLMIAANPSPLPEARFQLVGFTPTLLTGGAGVLGFTLECQKEFDGSRMCTSVEVMETTVVPSGLVGDAWVRPTFSPFGGGEPVTNSLDASGLARGSNTLTCSGWSLSVSDRSGLAVESGGSFTVNVSCSDPRPIACCALVP